MKEKGLALLIVVLFTFTLSIMGVTFLLMVDVDLGELSAQIRNIQAFYLAEGGIEKALWYLNRGEKVDFRETLDTGEYLIKAENSPYTKIISLAKINETKIELTVDAYDNLATPEKDYSLIPGTWKRRNIK
jgi:hypothetical protein